MEKQNIIHKWKCGTEEAPITLETTNGGSYPYSGTGVNIESTASNESILEYCYFKENVYFGVHNSSITVRSCTKDGNPVENHPR